MLTSSTLRAVLGDPPAGATVSPARAVPQAGIAPGRASSSASGGEGVGALPGERRATGAAGPSLPGPVGDAAALRPDSPTPAVEPSASGSRAPAPDSRSPASAGPEPAAEPPEPSAEPATAPEIDVTDPDAEALSAIPLVRRIEAVLFAATEPLPLKRLRELTACPDPRAVRDAIEGLAAGYRARGSAIAVEEIAQGFQLRTCGDVAAVVARLGRKPAEERLSGAALETLAVVAYRQPVLRADIEKIRGVACGEVLRALQERGFVRIAGRAELPGAPLLYGTTQRFLETFGLRDLKELPEDRELRRATVGARDSGGPSSGSA